MIELKNISKSYGQLEILANINLSIQEQKITSIIGSSGAGKSTLLHILGTILLPDKGDIFINDIQVNTLSEDALANFRNKHIGFIFQFHHLLPEFTAIENVSIPALIQGKSQSDAQPRAMELLNYLGLSHRFHHKPSEMSGGEQQRVAVARALMNQPSLILADEPSGNLDTKNAEELHQLFFKLNEDFKQTFVIVTHNEKLAAMSHHIVSMKDGHVVH
ncbi:MAG: ABC transporter ATP-binding protein [Chitinophagales bacterium]|nr:ABC transporter ATP-binding protein [Chitinophagales bacterium]